jgi:hypothetical protein
MPKGRLLEIVAQLHRQKAMGLAYKRFLNQTCERPTVLGGSPLQTSLLIKH